MNKIMTPKIIQSASRAKATVDTQGSDTQSEVEKEQKLSNGDVEAGSDEMGGSEVNSDAESDYQGLKDFIDGMDEQELAYCLSYLKQKVEGDPTDKVNEGVENKMVSEDDFKD